MRQVPQLFLGGVDLSDYDSDATVGAGGPSQFQGTFREGFLLGYASGRNVNKNLRVEWDTSLRNNSGDIFTNNNMSNSVPFDGHFNVYSTIFNAIWDFENCKLFSQSPFGLYIGGGIGFAKQNGEFDVNGNFFELKDWGFAYQALLGLTFWEGRRGSLTLNTGIWQ